MKMVWQIAMYAAMMLAALAAGCSDSPRDNYSERRLEGRVKLSIAEDTPYDGSAHDPRIYVRLETETLQPCVNWSIDAQLQIRGNQIALTLGNIRCPSICFTMMGPATYAEPLPVPAGRYTLAVKLYGKVDKYALDISDSAIVVDSIATSFSFLESGKLWRFPRQSFVYSCMTAATDSAIYDEFADSLRALPHLTQFELSDAFECPYWELKFPEADGHTPLLFRYAVEEDYAGAGALLQRFVTTRLEGKENEVSIRLRNWRNQEFTSR